MDIAWKGVFPALTTKFNADDTLDLGLFNKNLDFQVKCGVNGIILGGSLGEASVLTLEEKETLVKNTVARVGSKVPVILNIAEGATRDAISQAKLARKWGAAGLMLLPPMRYKSDHRETLEFLKSVASSTDLPIVIYNNPIDYKNEITLSLFADLMECENIQAVKESTRDVSNVTRMINRFGDRFKILCGVDTIAVEELALGADGWIAGLVCAFPAETVAIYNLVRDGQIEEAAKIYRWFMPMLEFDIHPKLVQYIKLTEAQVGLGSEWVRAPRLTLTGKERENILAVVARALSERPALPQRPVSEMQRSL